MGRTSRRVRARTRRVPDRKSRTGDQLPHRLFERVLAAIKAHPGIRPSELNRRLNIAQSDAVRNALIRRGLVRKEKDGSATRYYPV
jgi:uncharacterized membrane protein